MRVNRGPGYGLFEFSGYVFLGPAYCGRYGEVILRVGDAFYWPLLLSRGRSMKVLVRAGLLVRVNAWNVGRDKTSWPLWRGWPL